MREYLEQLLLVLAVGSGVAIVARADQRALQRRAGRRRPVLVLLNVLPETPMDPGVVLMVFLPILIFQGALSADATSLRQAARPILALAVPGVAHVAPRHRGRRVLGDRPAVPGRAAARRRPRHHRHRQRAARVPQRPRAAPAGRDHGGREPVQRRHRAGAGRAWPRPWWRRASSTSAEIGRTLFVAIVAGGAARRRCSGCSARWCCAARPTT